MKYKESQHREGPSCIGNQTSASAGIEGNPTKVVAVMLGEENAKCLAQSPLHGKASGIAVSDICYIFSLVVATELQVT